jgi:hypothetical protein
VDGRAGTVEAGHGGIVRGNDAARPEQLGPDGIESGVIRVVRSAPPFRANANRPFSGDRNGRF